MILEFLKKYEKESIIISMLLIIVSIFLIVKPGIALSTAVTLFAIVFIFDGIINIVSYMMKNTEIRAFSNELIMGILLLILGLIIYKKVTKKKIFENENKYIKYIAIPTAFYTLLVALSSHWIELRYIMPVCGLVFILIIYLLENVLENIFNEKNVFRILTVCLAIILITPIIFKMEPEEEFLDKRDIVEKVQNELNVPTIYMFNSNENRFLDDILLFSKLDNSYIAKDVECTNENINKILKGKDLSNGVLIFINGGQNNDDIMDKIKSATGLNEWKWIKGLNACNIYYIR